MPQGARRAAVRNFFLLLDIFPVCIAVPFTGVLCPLATQPTFPPGNRRRRPCFFAQRTPPALPVCKRPRSALIVRAGLSLLLDKQAAQRLSAVFARIPALPRPAADSFGIGFIAAVIPYATMHRIFDHARTICSILITTSKMPLHQSAGAFSLLSGLEQVLQQRIFQEKPHQNKAITHNHDFVIFGCFPRSSDSILLGKLPEQSNLFRFQAQGDL